MLSPTFFRRELHQLIGATLLTLVLASAGCAKTATPAAPAAIDPFVLSNCSIVAKEGTPSVADLFKPAADGAVACVGQPVSYLATRASYAEYELSLDLRWSGKPGNGGVLLAIGDPAADKVWPRCLQVQFRAGTIGELIPMDGFATAELKPGAKSVPRLAEATESPAGEWNALRIVVHSDTVECWLNGKLACRVTHCSPTAGRIGLQLEGAPFDFRNAKLKPLAAPPAK